MWAFSSILWQEFVLFKRKFWTITVSSMVSPILYLIAFGWGLGGGMQIDGRDYIHFVIPGIIALTTMTSSYNSISSSVNISRIYYKSFESFMIAPINISIYALAKIIAGALRGLYSGILIILLSFIFNTGLHITPYFMLMVVLNCLVFSAVGFIAGIVINSHQDMSRFSSFIITPMSFLCGTFFSLDKMPAIIKNFILILPLTHTSIALRSVSEDLTTKIVHATVLIAYFVILFIMSVKFCKKAE